MVLKRFILATALTPLPLTAFASNFAALSDQVNSEEKNYRILGGVYLGMQKKAQRVPLGGFKQALGTLKQNSGIGTSGAQGKMAIKLESWTGPHASFNKRMETHIQKSISERPYGALIIKSLSGLREDTLRVGQSQEGKLVASLSLVDLEDEIEIPVRVARIQEDLWVIESMKGTPVAISETEKDSVLKNVSFSERSESKIEVFVKFRVDRL